MKRILLPAALAFTLAGGAAFAQQTSGALQSDGTTAPATTQTAPENGQGMHHHRRQDPTREAAHLAKRLNLSQDQQQKLVPILEEREQRMNAVKSDTTLSPEQRHEQMRGVMKSTQESLATVLNKDQLAQLHTMRMDHHGRRRSMGEPDAQQPAPQGL